MKSLTEFICEWVLNKDAKKHMRKKNEYKHTPNTKYDLKKITSKRYVNSTDLNLNDIFTINVEDMSYLFSDYVQLTSVDVRTWKVMNVKTFECMFKDCKNLKEIKGLESWAVDENANLTNMFLGCDDSIIPSWYDRKKWETK